METPNMSRCDQLTNQYYKNLCNTLAIKPGTNPNVKPFTGNKATDIIILEKLNDNDLISVCSTNKYLNDLCNTEYFWMNRTLAKFPFLGTGEEIVNRYIPEGVGWKEYYIWLSDMALRDINILSNFPYRNDIQLLLSAKKGEGFATPKIMTDNMLQFFRNVDLGKVDPRDPKSPNLRDVLYSLRTGISTYAILSVLFNIYVKVNYVQDPDEPSYLIANPEMYHYFRNTFTRLQNKPQKYIQDVPIPKFNPKRFRYSDLHSIISNNIIKPFSPEYDYRYEAPDMDALKRDQQIVSKTLHVYTN